MAVEDEGLAAVQAVAGAVSFRCRGDLVRGVAGAFLEREGKDVLAGEQRGKIFGLLVVRTGLGQQRGGQQRRGHQRRGGQGAAGGLHHLGEAGHAEGGAAVVLRHQEPGPAEFGHLAPERAGKPVGIVAVSQFAQRGDGAALAEEVERGFPHHQGFFGQCQGHGANPAGQARAWR